MKQHASTQTALRIASIYVAVALLWITTSDSVLMFSTSDPATRAMLGWLKGCVFVGITGGVLFALVRQRLRERDLALVKEQAASLLLKELARISTSPLLICDRHGHIISLNSQAMRACGMDEHTSSLAMGNLSKLTAAGCGWLLSSIERATRLEQAETVVESVALASGPATMQIFRGPLPGQMPGQNPIGYFVSAVDLTELTQTQSLLHDSERRYKLMFDANPHPMWLYDTQTCAFLAVNEAAVAQYGYGHDEFMRMTIFDIRARDQSQRLLDYLVTHEEHAQEAPTQAGTWRHQDKAGKALDVEIIYVDLQHAGRPARLVLARNVTAALKVEQALKASQEQLAELTQRLLVQDQLTTQRVAQALHDDLGQRLFACTVLLETATASTDATALAAIQAKALSQVQAAMSALRSVLVDLRPPFLEDGGLMSALKYELARIYPHGMQIDLLDFTEGKRWEPHIEYGVFMIAREAVLNAIQHAHAHTISTQVTWTGSSLLVTVADDGRGIPEELLLGRPGHLGITGMRERAASLAGKLRILSSPGQGAKVCFELKVATP